MNKLAKLSETPTIVTLEGSPVRCFSEDGEPNMWLSSTDLGGAIGLSKNRITQILRELEDEDKGVKQCFTPGGRQSVNIVSRSGAYQIIAQLRDKELGRRLRKWLADLGVAYETGRLSEQVLAQVNARLSSIENIVGKLAEVLAALAPTLERLAGPAVAVRPMRIGMRDKKDLMAWTVAEHKRQRAQGYCTAGEVLHKELGRRVTASEASSLSARTRAYCRDHKLDVRQYYMGGAVRLYMPEISLKLVHRTKWSRKNAVMAEAQGDLFRNLGDA